MFDVLPDAVITLDAERHIIAVNQAAETLTGYSARELVGRPLSVLAPRSGDGQPVLSEGWHRSAQLPRVKRLPEQEVVIRHGRGDDTLVRVVGKYQRGGDGVLQGVVLSLRPVRRLGQTGESGIQIVSVVAHELRSPLTSVKGYTSLLLNRWERLGDDDKKMMLEQVNRDADRVTRLITELLDISRLETGRLVLHREMVDIPELAAAVVEKVKLEHPDLACDMSFVQPFPEVYADPDKVTQVLTNLLENACKYASPVGISLEGRANADEVSVAVRDRGPGLQVRDLTRVFTKFFRTADTRPTGSGLGLWISKGLVEAHGGRLEAVPAHGGGAVFRFALPRDGFQEANP